MTKIIMNGCNGKMGQVITRLVSEDNECEIVAGFDVNDSIENTYPVFTNPDEFTGDADVIIDFSHASALTTVLNYCKKRKLPVILATTGYTDEQKKEFTEASKEIPVFFSANMSLGINLIIALAKKATKLLEGNFDIEIVERHHNQKIDAPSGTALAIADAIDETLSYPAEYVYDRHAVRRKRKPTEIGIHAVRGGTIVGDHEVIFAGTDEVIELKHSAHSKEVFAVGAIKAAKLRFRAIMMTELAFIIGVLPMIFASGAGANSRISVGSTVFGGMIAAATLGAALTPAFYVIVQEFVDKFPKKEITDEDLEI